IQTSLEFTLRAQSPSRAEDFEKLEGLLAVLDSVEQNAAKAKTSVTGAADQMRTSPRPERSYNRAVDITARELGRYAQNLDETVGMLSRAKRLLRDVLSRRGQ